MSAYDHSERFDDHGYPPGGGAALPAKGAPLPSPAPSTLSPGQIAEALTKSPDGGATIDLTHLSLTDVGESGAEELATIGREQGVDEESSLVRCVMSFVLDFCSGAQPA
jgi:hypothetical protein